jgi:hypothetical protein
MWGHMSTTDLPGSSLLAGRYRLVERLGAGGMSVVWRGFDEVLGRQVAVKVLPPSTSADPSFRRRLRAEAQAAARLSHPNITNVYDYGEATTADGEAVPYVVMELVDGESLAAVLGRERRLPWPAAVRISAEVSAALAAAHARGIAHRDVTPANVMLTSSGAKVVDFGISALIGENDIDPDGSLLGTPAYLAPERLEGGQVSPASDVYAVGLLIYRTLIGQLPWDVGTTTALLRAHQYSEPDPLPPVEGLPHAVSALIGRCLEKDPDDRPSSAELAHVLAGVAADSPSVPDRRESGEDTTILPSAHPYTGGLRRAAAAAAAAAAARAAVPVPAAAAQGETGSATGDEAAGAGPVAAPGDPKPADPADPAAPVPAQAGPPPAALRAGAASPPSHSGPPSSHPGSPSSHPGSPSSPPAPAQAGPPPPAPLPGRPARRHAGQTRRVLTLAAAVALVALSVYGWSLNSTGGGSNLDRRPNSLVQPAVVAATGKCVVSYAVWSDDGERFKATVTVANRDTRPVKDWQLWWIMQGDQTLSGNGKLRLDQQGTAVTVEAPKTLSPRTAVTMDVTGRYDESNAAPMVFELNDKSCETYVSGAPGQPSRPVQKLADGRVVLGPPVTDKPVPGISTRPDGVAVPIPGPVAVPDDAASTPAGSEDPPVSAPPVVMPPPGGGVIEPPPPQPEEKPLSNPPTTTTDAGPPPTTPPAEEPPDTDPADQDPADQDPADQ